MVMSLSWGILSKASYVDVEFYTYFPLNKIPGNFILTKSRMLEFPLMVNLPLKLSYLVDPPISYCRIACYK